VRVKLDYTKLSVACILLSLPLSWLVLQRDMGTKTVPTVRIASFNAAMNRKEPTAMLAELRAGSEQARKIAEVVQRADIDVLLLCELDRDEGEEAARVFAKDYLAVSQNGQKPIDFAHVLFAASNTGEPSGRDLDRDGKSDGPGDAYGYGKFRGQYAMALLSRHPIRSDAVRTFRMLPWSAMPNALRPAGYWSDEDWNALRLSSKSHWDVPVRIAGRDVHMLCSHPTPPAFDGAEDRNGCRNHDEIRFWLDYLTPERSQWIVDDQGARGGLAADSHFVVLGDLNCDPIDGDSKRDALLQLLAHPRVFDLSPKSAGGKQASLEQWALNAEHKGDAACDTADFEDEAPKAGAPGTGGPGNLRVDYALPSRSLYFANSAVYWPTQREPGGAIVGASDHRLVFVDVGFAPAK